MISRNKVQLLLWIKKEINYLLLNDNVDLLNEFNKSCHEIYANIKSSSIRYNKIIPKDFRLVDGKTICINLKLILKRSDMYIAGESKSVKESFINKIQNELNSVDDKKLYKMTELDLTSIQPATEEDLVMSLVHIAFRLKRNKLFANEINFII